MQVLSKDAVTEVAGGNAVAAGALAVVAFGIYMTATRGCNFSSSVGGGMWKIQVQCMKE